MASSELQEIDRWPARSKKVWRRPHPQLMHARLQTTKRASPLNGKRRLSIKKNNHSQRKPVETVAAQSTQGLIALQRRKNATNVVRVAILAVFVEANLLVVAEAMIEVAPNQEGVLMNSQMKLVYALDGYQCNVEDAHGRGQHTCPRSDVAELLPDV